MSVVVEITYNDNENETVNCKSADVREGCLAICYENDDEYFIPIRLLRGIKIKQIKRRIQNATTDYT